MQLQSTLTCPKCSYQAVEVMPTDACQSRPSLTAKREEWRMNGLSKQDHHLSPQDPLYYGPGSLRKRSMSPLTPSTEPFSSSASFNNQFETVASEGRPHVFESETDRRMTLTGVVARFAAAIGVLALVALFLAIAVPNLPHQKDGSKAALAEFQPFLASVEASQSATREPSEKLLQRFMQWRQKSTSTRGP
jgi:hypothetical protein